MVLDIVVPRWKFSDKIQLYYYGYEICEKGHSWGPGVRDHYLLHVIFDGKGYFRKDGVVKTLTKNQAFLIRPGEITFYQADLDAPWTYAWIGFVGGQSCQFLHEGKLAESSVFEIEEGNLARKYLKQLLRTDANAPESIFRLRGLMYLFLSEIYKQLSDEEEDLAINVQQEIYIEKAIDFVERNYSRNIGVADVVSYVGLNRSYFSQLFRTCLKISPQEYLIQFRMKKAKELLATTSLAVGDIARSVGYVDPFNFSKAFKKHVGVSPSLFREMNAEEKGSGIN